jgi:cytochrome P450 family 6
MLYWNLLAQWRWSAEHSLPNTRILITFLTISEVTMDVIAAQAFVFFVAGFETSSTTMMFCLYEMALHPDMQERLQAEIDSVTQQHDGNITYESILGMQYLDKVVSGECHVGVVLPGARVRGWTDGTPYASYTHN